MVLSLEEEPRLTASLVFCFTFSLFVSLVCTKIVRDIAVRKGWRSAPTDPRHIHTTAIPRLGGIAICLSQVATLAALFVYFKIGTHFAYRDLRVCGLMIPFVIVFTSGLCDDIWDLPARAKVAGQILAAVATYFLGFRVEALGLFRLLGMPTVGPIGSFLFTVAWVLLITNAFNLIDGLDGLAAGSAFVSVFVLFVFAVLSHAFWAALFALSLGGSILGFLYYNFNPATIFLGDSGSQSIGYALAALSLASSQKAPTIVAVGVPIIAFGFPILDVLMAILRRFLNGRSLFGADGEHIHHRLLRNGLSHRKAVLVLYGLSSVFGLLSLVLLRRNGFLLSVVITTAVSVTVLFVRRLGYHEVDELRRLAIRTIHQRDVVAHNLRFRRLEQALKLCKHRDEMEAALIDGIQESPFDAFVLQWRPGASSGALLRRLNRVSPEYRFSWTRGKCGSPEFPLWRVEIAILDERGNAQGQFSVARALASDPLPLDINLLHEQLQPALANALLRCVNPARTETLARPDHVAVRLMRYSQALSGD